MFLFISLTHFLCSSPIFLGFLVRDDSGAPHWASTVREEAEDEGTPCAGAAAAAAAGEVGGDWCGWPWPWPWELVRWRRHLKDPACVGGAHTHLAPPPWLWPPPEDADEKLRRMARGDAAAPVGVVPALWWWWCGPWNRPSSPVVST